MNVVLKSKYDYNHLIEDIVLPLTSEKCWKSVLAEIFTEQLFHKFCRRKVKLLEPRTLLRQILKS